METICYSCQWLLWTTFILFMYHYLEVSGSQRVCPQGQLLHDQGDFFTCCYPTRCGVGEKVMPCDINGTQDKCVWCDRYQNQSLRTSSYTMDRCTDWPLDKECRSITNPEKQRDFQDKRTKRCMCNIEQGKKFDPPESELPGVPMDSYCQRRSEQCKPGFEPVVDGDCQPCKNNYFKSVEGYSLCEPKTNCILLGLEYTFQSISSTTDDNNCSEPEPIITKPSITQRPVSTTAVPKTTTTTEVIRETSTPVPTTSIANLNTTLGAAVRPSEEDNVLWPIVGSLFAVVTILVCIGFSMFYCRRRRLLVCVYAAAKDCADGEDIHGQGCHYEPMNGQVKFGTANGSSGSQSLITRDKINNNGINGRMPSDFENLPNGHARANIDHFIQAEHRHDDIVQHTNPLHYTSVNLPRPGVLRSGNKCVMFSKRQTNWPDLTIDIMSQNRPQGDVDGFEANPQLGESDCLLISEHPQGASSHQLSGSIGSSPAVMHDNMSPVQILTINGCKDPNFGHLVLKNGQFLPPLRPRGPAVHVDGATFTRSVSLIASPEGEIDEEERAAIFPRFSQLLQDGDDSLTSEPTLVLDPHQVTKQSNGPHQVTQQLNGPHQVTKQSNGPHQITQQSDGPHQVIQQLNGPHQVTQQSNGFSPLQAASVPHRYSNMNQPEHSIMNLKEQDLVGPKQPTPTNTVSVSKGKTSTDPKPTSNHTSDVPEEAQQTQLKILGCPQVFSNCSDCVNTNIAAETCKYVESKQSESEGVSDNLEEMKRHLSPGVNGHEATYHDFQNSSDQRHSPIGGCSGQIVLKHPRTVAGNDHQTLCVRSSHPEQCDASKDKHLLNNRVTFFGNSDNLHTNGKKPSPRGDLLRPARSQGSSEAAGIHSKTLGSATDSEKTNTPQAGSDVEDTECNPSTHRTHVSNTSSKASLNSDLTDNCSGNSSTGAVYRRSQSHNAPSSSECSHKPPPRSMSEEKPQKLDRPVAKVKPMPASDNSVNQLPADAPGDVGPLPQPLVCTNNNNLAVFLSSSTEESDQEQNVEMNCESPSTLQEDEEEDAESRTETTGV